MNKPTDNFLLKSRKNKRWKCVKCDRENSLKRYVCSKCGTSQLAKFISIPAGILRDFLYAIGGSAGYSAYREITEKEFSFDIIIFSVVISVVSILIATWIGGGFMKYGIINNEAALPMPTKANTIKTSEETKKSNIYQFLLSSFEAWGNGIFDGISDNFKKSAIKESPEVSTAEMLNESSIKIFLEQCFKVREPDTDEFLFGIVPNNFMITNKCLYINTNTKQGQLHITPLCEIVYYASEGFWKFWEGTLRLKNGKEIQFELKTVPDEGKLRQLQELLNCEQLIDG